MCRLSSTTSSPPERLHVQHPPTYAWYLAGLVFEWLKEQGGLAAMEARNRRRPTLRLPRSVELLWQQGGCGLPLPHERALPAENEALDKLFLAESEAAGLLALKGHRIVGGMRASLYNAMPLEGSRPWSALWMILPNATVEACLPDCQTPGTPRRLFFRPI